MTRVLFIPMSWGRGMGPLQHCMAVAKALPANVEVAFVCKEQFTSLVQNKGYSVYPNVSPPAPQQINSENLALFVRDFPAFQGMNDEGWVRKMIEFELAAIETYSPDILFSALQFTAPIVSKLSARPLASIARWVGHPDFTSPVFGGGQKPISSATSVFNRILLYYGFSEIKTIWELDFLRSDLKIVAGLPELEPQLSSVANLFYCGHLHLINASTDDLVAQLAEWSKDYPTVFVYLSNKQFQPAQYFEVLQSTFKGTEYRVIVSTGLQFDTKLPAASENIRYVRWMNLDNPSVKIDTIISASTRGMLWQAGLRGATMVAFPGKDYERLHTAEMMETAGIGKTLSDDEFSPEHIIRVVKEVSEPIFRHRALHLKKRLLDLGGPTRAADLLMDLASGSLPSSQ